MGCQQPAGEPGFVEYRRWKGWDSTRFGACTAEDAATFTAELRDVTRGAPQGLSVLEIGFGNGSFARWAIDRGWRYVGTETDPELVARARSAGMPAFDAEAAREGLRQHGPFDLVVAWDVLEHVPDRETPALLADCRAALVGGGAMVARMPAAESPFSRGIQHGDATHVRSITSHRARRDFLAAGFSSCEVRATRLSLRGVPLASLVRRMLVRGVDAAVHPVVRILVRDRNAVLTPNMIAVARP